MRWPFALALCAGPLRWPFALEGKVPTLLRVLLRKSTLGQSRAKRALDEYRRFLYLAALEGAKVAPPPLIQAIWRAHAGNWRGYHQDLCQTVLRRKLPEPFDAPVPLSDPIHAATRTAYRREFNAEPPTVLWPRAWAMRWRRALSWVNRSSWLIVVVGGMAYESVVVALLLAGLALAAMLAQHTTAPWGIGARDDDLDLDFGGSDGDGDIGGFSILKDD